MLSHAVTLRNTNYSRLGFSPTNFCNNQDDLLQIKEHCTRNFFLKFQYNYFLKEAHDVSQILVNIKESRFKAFFKDLDIDTPCILNKTKSLKRLGGATHLNKLSAYLLRSGKKLKVLKVLLYILNGVSDTIKSSFFLDYKSLNWRSLYFTTVTYLHKSSALFKFSNLPYNTLSLNYKLSRDEISKLEYLTTNELIFQTFKKFNFLFSFYIYKVDKQIYKNSRGKSGKYTFVWKYVAPYKRNLLALHWLIKEMRITSGKTIYSRVTQVLNNFLFNTNHTWIWKIKRFSLNYTYFNLRRTLGETYRTSMR